MSLSKKSQMTTANQRTRGFIKNLQYGSIAQPSTLTKYQNRVFILRIIFHRERCDLAITFKTLCLHLLLSDCAAIPFPDTTLNHHRPCRKKTIEGGSG
jgi:hypothetical protein